MSRLITFVSTHVDAAKTNGKETMLGMLIVKWLQHVGNQSINDRIPSLDGRVVERSGTMSMVRARHYLRSRVSAEERVPEWQVLAGRDGSL